MKKGQQHASDESVANERFVGPPPMLIMLISHGSGEQRAASLSFEPIKEGVSTFSSAPVVNGSDKASQRVDLKFKATPLTRRLYKKLFDLGAPSL